MRVMVLVKATKDSEAGLMSSAELLTAMGKFNEELAGPRHPPGCRGPASVREGQARGLRRPLQFKPTDLFTKLKNRIGSVLGEGPLKGRA
jgi:hypothetical protein